MEKNSKIYIPGHTGLVGAALLRKLKASGYHHLIYKTRQELDLLSQAGVTDFFKKERPEYLFLCAAKVGGIHANMTYPADFMYENLMIQSNLIHNSAHFGVKRLIFLGSSCIYPKMSPQPIKESFLMTGALEPTNAPYATAKIAGISLCQSYNRQYGTSFISAMPTNIYGPEDHFDLENSHVIPALIRKIHLARLSREKKYDAIKRNEDRFGPIPEPFKKALFENSSSSKRVDLWGTGTPLREFLYTDDLADALIFLMNIPIEKLNLNGRSETGKDKSISFVFNIGYGKDITIKELAHEIQKSVGYKGEIFFDRGKPDGTPRKLLDISKVFSLGWRPKITLKEGIKRTYAWYIEASKKECPLKW